MMAKNPSRFEDLRDVQVFLREIAHANYLTTEFTEHTERVGILDFTLCVLCGLCGLNFVRNLFPKKTRTWRKIFIF